MKKLTVSIGIPALNEENTIQPLLLSILSQAETNYRLEKIYIVLDGSTDNTASVIKTIKDKRIVVTAHPVRKGKATRMNELFRKNTSDIFVLFDADILLKDTQVISQLIKKFSDPSITLISANNQALRPSEFIGKIWYAAEYMWYEMRKDADNAKTLFNNSGGSIALRKRIAKKMVLPVGAVADQQFVYFYNRELGGTFYFEKDAYVYYLPPSNLQDILIQYKRSPGEERFFAKHFGSRYDSFFQLPGDLKRRGFMRAFAKDPLYTVLAMILLKILQRTVKETNEENASGTWPRTASTKKPIYIQKGITL